MHIQVNTDHNTDGRTRVAEYVRGVVIHALTHFSGHITRVDVHLGDENGPKAGPDDKRCTIEAKVENRPALAVTHRAGTLDAAISGAAGKLKRSLAHDLKRQHAHR
jgi:ribosome-associated translation inhibitor RaiA